MIISHSLKAIFLRVPKTGSTSFEATLRMSGIFDFGIDQLTTVDDIGLPRVNLSEEFGFNYFRDAVRVRTKPISANSPLLKDPPVPWGHATVSDIVRKNLISESKIDEYKVYAFVRDPYDRAISAWQMTNRTRVNSKEQFEKYWELGGPADQDDPRGLVLKPQKDFFTLNGQMLTNIRPLLFEDYEKEVRSVISEYNGMQLAELPRFKSRIASPITKEPGFITENTAQLIEQRCQEDIDFWNPIYESSSSTTKRVARASEIRAARESSRPGV